MRLKKPEVRSLPSDFFIVRSKVRRSFDFPRTFNLSRRNFATCAIIVSMYRSCTIHITRYRLYHATASLNRVIAKGGFIVFPYRKILSVLIDPFGAKYATRKTGYFLFITAYLLCFDFNFYVSLHFKSFVV